MPRGPAALTRVAMSGNRLPPFSLQGVMTGEHLDWRSASVNDLALRMLDAIKRAPEASSKWLRRGDQIEPRTVQSLCDRPAGETC